MILEGNSAQEEVCSIYVGNVPWKATPAEIAEVITASTGIRVKEVRIVKEKGTGRSRGFAFVDLYYHSSQGFVSLNPELVLNGRLLTVKYANERKAPLPLSPVSIQRGETAEEQEANVLTEQFVS